MPLNTNKVDSGNSITPLENGAYPARVAAVIDLGLQPQRPYEGKDKPPMEEVMLSYELADEFLLDEDGEEDLSKPRMISERFVVYNLDSERAKSTQRYKAIDPKLEKDGDFAELVGMPVNVTIVQNPGKNGRVYENVAGLTPMREKEASKLGDLVNEPRLFDLSDPDLDVFKELYSWQQDIIVKNLNFEGSALQAALNDDPDYDAPDTSSSNMEEIDDDEDNPF